MLSASPQHSDAMVKAATEPMNTLRQPYCSLSLPATGRMTTNPSEYAVMVHPAQSIDVCKLALHGMQRCRDDGPVDRHHQQRERDDGEDQPAVNGLALRAGT